MRRARFLVIILAVAVGAYLAGQFVGDLIAEQSKSGYIDKRQSQTRSYLEVRRLGVGDTLPDHSFETLRPVPESRLGFDTILLSSCLSEKTFLVVIHPDCATCLDELEQIAQIQRQYGKVGPFVFISSANPRMLSELQQTYELANFFLYDHRAAFLSRYDLSAYPMFIRVSRDRVIQEIMLGELLPEEIELAFKDGE